MRIQSALALMSLVGATACATTKVSFDAANNTVINGKTIFPISLAVLPPVDGKTPNGGSAWQEFSKAGVNFARVAPGDYWDKHGWEPEGLHVARKYMDQLAKAKINVWLTLGDELSYVKPDDQEGQSKLKEMLKMFKDHPALGGWKGADEPQWGNMNTKGKRPPESIATAYKLVHEVDPNHPVLVLQAPRGTAADNAAYDAYLDITGMDVFPVGYPPGGHVPTWPNKQISMVGDWTKIIVEAAQGKPVWMTLQIAWSGVAKKGKTLRFPTFPQERFMTYEAIINGARGVNYFGGGHGVAQTLSERDRPLGYNWTFWERVLKPVLAEINETSPLHTALVAANSRLPVKAEGAAGVEFTVREVGEQIFILACKREGETAQVTFSGLPTAVTGGDVLYESPRKVEVSKGQFTDWFGPEEVHVYRLGR
ncbi:MAG TPA: hypothetical protein VLT36_03500 [Candidatus Dormibacteraeota bacterium]|nr:hypothetical protein [Candidatus Dormibacteraeota bacterium]